MDKLNRNIDEQRMNESKMNTIDYVMETISVTKEKRFSLSFTKLRLASMLSIIVIAIVSILVLDPFNTTPPAPSAPVVLTTFETEKLAELSYLSGRLIASSFSVNNQSSLMRLRDNDETEFEANIDEFNTYFDMLKVFLDDDAFSNSVTVTSLEEGDYDTSIEFYVDGKLYTFLVIVIDDEISGQLTINSQVFSVEGKYEETDTELSMELIASSGNDYIKIKYKTENEDEIEKKYEIEQYIDGIERIKEIKVSIENDEQKVEITEDNDSYALKKEIEDTIVVYKLSYEIDDIEGEVEICETIDDLGATVYSYKIDEGDKHKELDLDDPDEDEEEDEEEDEDEEIEDEDEEEDEEEEDEEEDTEDQSNPYFKEIKINVL